MPLMILFAAVLVVQLVGWIRMKQWVRSGVVLIGGILLYVLCWWNPYGLSKEADAQTYFSLGNAYLKLDRYVQARDDYQRALALDPDYQQVHLNMGVSFYRQGNWEAAEEEYRRELSLHPESIMAMNNLGALALHQGKNEEASQWFRKALAIKPYYNDARVNLAESLFRQGYYLAQEQRFSEAEIFFQEAVDLAPSRSMYRYNLAVVLAATGHTDQAQQQWETAHAIDSAIPPLPNYTPIDSPPDTTP
jgi:tetratricopeptide (TPR) repeat protein